MRKPRVIRRETSTSRMLFVLGCFALVVFVWVGNDLLRGLESTSNSYSKGTYADGGIVDSKRLPSAGPNFRVYSRLGATIGRNCVHHAVRQTITSTYQSLGVTDPDLQFVYGETGWCWGGGKFAPHRTHQNGLSVDFMVPVRKSGLSLPLPHSIIDKFGYALEFSPEGKVGEYEIDFEAIMLHLQVLNTEARKNDLKIKRVIFAPDLQKKLAKLKGGKRMMRKLKFSKKQAWVRHDDHYHVDFEVSPQANGEPAPTRGVIGE